MQILSSIISRGAVFVGVFLPATAVFADNPPANTIKGNLKESASSVFSQSEIAVVIGSIVTALLGVLGVVFLALLIYGGFLYMTDLGDEKQAATAKKLITNATIGLVIVAVSFAVTKFVLDSIGGAAGVSGSF